MAFALVAAAGWSAADDLSWDGGAATDLWGDAANWSGDALPTQDDNAVIGDLPEGEGASVRLDAGTFARRITLQNGAVLDTDQQRLHVLGNLVVRGDGTRLLVREPDLLPNPVVDAYNLLLRDNAVVELAPTVDLEDLVVVVATPGAGVASFGEVDIDPDSMLLSTGGSTVRFRDFLDGGQATQLVNDGVIRVTQPASPVAHRTYKLLVESSDAGTIADLDGDTGSGRIDLGAFSQLHVRTATTPFGGVADLGDSARLRFDQAVTFAGTAVVNSDNGVSAGNRISSDVSVTIESGAAFNATAGMLSFFGDLTAAPGSEFNVADGATLSFNYGVSTVSGDVNLGAGNRFETTHGDVTLDNPAWDWDGAEDALTDINNGSVLRIVADDIESTDGDNLFNGEVRVVGGATPADASQLRTTVTQGWRLGGRLEVRGSVDGTRGAASFLNGPTAMTVEPAGVVDLDGGSFESEAGGQIVNEGTVQGSGLVGAEGFVNNGLLRAVAGDNDTVLRTTLARNFDLDGDDQVNPGGVEAVEGDVAIQGRLSDNFGGVATVGPGRTLDFQIGWTLGAPATLNLNGTDGAATVASSGIDNGGMNQADDESALRGTVNVTGLGRIVGDVTFRPNATTNLPNPEDRLELGDAVLIRDGANFVGDGTVALLADAETTLEPDAEVATAVENAGLLSPEGAATFAAFAQLGAGELALDLGGTAAGEYDALAVTGDAALDGLLSVSLTGGFTPTLGDEFTILTASAVTGAFVDDPGLLPDLGPELGWELLYGATDVLLRVTSDDVTPLEGDYNGDGIVNAADYTVWRDTLDSTTELAADGDGDGQVDADDYDLWAANYGASLGATSQAVPEPLALTMAALATLAAPRRRD